MLDRFQHRSYEAELMDAPDVAREALFRNLHELNFINRTLGGHSVTIKGMKELITDKNKEYHIVDIGCGGGDAMIAIAEWARRNVFKVKITGVDINPHAMEFANGYCKNYREISCIQSDYKDYLTSGATVDIAHCALFCHHLKDQELVELFDRMANGSRVGFVINDLQRNWFAYHSIKVLTSFFSSSVLVKNDAPLSVLRGFSRDELLRMLKSANVKDVYVAWKWAFRYLVVFKKNHENNL
ncbi:MAG: methyltransferase domain-containing protein [Bacteroidia bacterium]|jgi:2-polyprenyl-3-methyl-5-hydroxy-6-metoxy-1,4-benzoquinol methylase